MSSTLDPLSPTEAYVLLAPGTADGSGAIRASLLHLAATGHVRAEAPRKRSWLDTSSTRIARGAKDSPLPEHLSAVLEALFPPGEEGAQHAPTTVVHRLQRAFGYDYGRYLNGHVREPLVRRGLLAREEYRALRFIPRTRFAHTADGERIRQRLEAEMRRADEVVALVPRDPGAAAAAALRMGGLILVAEGVRPHLPALAAAAREHSAEELIRTLDEDERRTDWLDAADLLTGVDWSAVFEAIDSMGDAFDGGADGGDGGGGE